MDGPGNAAEKLFVKSCRIVYNEMQYSGGALPKRGREPAMDNIDKRRIDELRDLLTEGELFVACGTWWTRI